MKIERLDSATLYCGDCLSILQDIPDTFDAVLTDPPYACTENKWDTEIDLSLLWQRLLPHDKGNTAYCIFCQGAFMFNLGASNKRMYRYDLIYPKRNGTGFLNAKRMPLRNHENVLVFYQKLPTYNPQKWQGKPYTRITTNRKKLTANYSHFNGKNWATISSGERFPLSILPQYDPRICKSGGRYAFHPTQKPLGLMEYLIKTYTNPGDLVVDPFMGSGTTGLAAIRTGRRFIGIELEEKYFDIACRRMRGELDIPEPARTQQEQQTRIVQAKLY